jgi:hypothetical protein
MAKISTTEDTNNRFDRIESILAGLYVNQNAIRSTGTLTLTGKRKEQVINPDNEDEEDLTDNFADSQEHMDAEDNSIHQKPTQQNTEGEDNHTNSPKDGANQHMRLK